ncbi:MAG: glutaredoxin 3 [Glaciimonas sp.]|nr:glutaredoxin 3 [Glaciimonas sp.]
MAKVIMYNTQWCPFCQRAEQLLQRKGVTEITMIDIDREPGERVVMIARTGRRSVPQIYVGETHVGGYDDLSALDRAGRLDVLLAQ